MKTKSKMGRPLFDADTQKRRNITLSDKLADKAKKLGEGNISAGIRIALKKVSAPH